MEMNVMEVVAPWEGINKALGLSGPIKGEKTLAVPRRRR
jgi:hypothetical protein